MAERTVTFDIRADISEFRKQLKESSNITEEEANAMVKSLRRSVNSAARAYRSMSKQQREFEQRLQKVRTGAEKVFGGIVGDVLDVKDGFLALSGPLQAVVGAFGVMGISAVAATTAIVATGGALAAMGATLHGIVSSAEGFNEELSKLDEFEGIAGGQAESFARYNDSIAAVKATAKAFVVLLASELAPAMEKGAFLLVKLALMAKDLSAAFLEGVDIVDIYANSVARQLAPAFEGLAKTVAKQWQLWVDFFNLVGATDTAGRLQSIVDKLNNFEAPKVGGLTIAFNALNDLTGDYNEKAKRLIGQMREINSEGGKQKQIIEETVQVWGDISREQQANLDQQLAAIEKEKQARLAHIEEVRKATIEAHQENLRILRERQAEYDKNRDAWINAVVTGFTAISDIEQAFFEKRLANVEEMSEAEKESLRKEFARIKAIRVSETIIAGAVAVVQALAQLGPVAGAAAGVGIAATTAASVAKIASEEPSFHTGMAPDETRATLTRGESVLDPRATRAMGKEQIDDMNRGIGGSMPPIRLSIAGKDLDVTMERISRAGGKTQRRIDGGRKVGQINPYVTDRS